MRSADNSMKKAEAKSYSRNTGTGLALNSISYSPLWRICVDLN